MNTIPATPRRTRPWKQRLGTLAAAVVILSAMGVAFAQWIVDGTGSGSADAMTAERISATATAADLFPGAEHSATFLISNPNPFAIEVTDITFEGSVSVDGGAAGCTAVSSKVSFVDVSGAALHVPAGAIDEEVPVPDLVTMDLDSHNDCQGAAFSQTATLIAVAAS